ncbi:MAG: hypothetical protein ACI841_005052, partial [Planctomycetota bacterium]
MAHPNASVSQLQQVSAVVISQAASRRLKSSDPRNTSPR